MTSHSTSDSSLLELSHEPRTALRLRLSPAPGTGRLDGGWWPQSRDLAVELADLVDHFPAALGRVDRAVYSPPDWDTRPRAVTVARGRVKTGSFPEDDTHLMVLALSTRTSVRLLVVPPDHPAGEQAMEIAADPANRWTADHVLAVPRFAERGQDSRDHWNDDGGTWWQHGEGPPSYR